MRELIEVLDNVTIPIEEIVASGGGGEAKGTQRLRRALVEKGWMKGRFKIVKWINDVEKESVTHEIDHVRTMPDGTVLALEIEWNNKDPFFDRDLENFKRLHTEGAISAAGNHHNISRDEGSSCRNGRGRRRRRKRLAREERELGLMLDQALAA